MDENRKIATASTEPIYDAFVAGGADEKLAYTAATRVETLAGASIITAVEAKIEVLRAYVDKQFKELSGRLAGLEWMIKTMMAMVLVLAGMVFTLQWRVGELNGNVKTMEARLTQIGKDVAELDEETATRFAELDEEIEERFTKQDEDLAAIRTLLTQVYAASKGRANSAAAGPVNSESPIAASAESP